MKKINIIHLGMGNIGREVKAQIIRQQIIIEKNIGVSLQYFAEFNSKNSVEEINCSIKDVSLPFVLIDTTSSDKTVPHITAALRRGGSAVLSNKKPLTMRQKQYDLLQQLGQGRLFYETTVGAGLPVIKTLKELILTGDETVKIQGCLSGTLGFLFSVMEDGESFANAVKQAMDKGFTEPDPRDDLSGTDIARKALILSRLLGLKLEMKDIKAQKLYPDNFDKFAIQEFLQKIKNLDCGYKMKFDSAQKSGSTFRYTVNISPKSCRVILTEVPVNSDLGSLKGPDNMIVFKTRRYSDRPMVIKGPGAGVEVTAAGVFADLLTVAGMI